jgi:hypothetical protein
MTRRERRALLREIAPLGGAVRVPKGFATMDPEKHAAALRKSLATRRKKAKKK